MSCFPRRYRDDSGYGPVSGKRWSWDTRSASERPLLVGGLLRRESLRAVIKAYIYQVRSESRLAGVKGNDRLRRNPTPYSPRYQVSGRWRELELGRSKQFHEIADENRQTPSCRSQSGAASLHAGLGVGQVHRRVDGRPENLEFRKVVADHSLHVCMIFGVPRMNEWKPGLVTEGYRYKTTRGQGARHPRVGMNASNEGRMFETAA